jgi:hypothetical protein
MPATASKPGYARQAPEGAGEKAGAVGASRIPREARDGLMRAWIEILKERHPGVVWIARDPLTRTSRTLTRATEALARTRL